MHKGTRIIILNSAKRQFRIWKHWLIGQQGEVTSWSPCHIKVTCHVKVASHHNRSDICINFQTRINYRNNCEEVVLNRCVTSGWCTEERGAAVCIIRIEQGAEVLTHAYVTSNAQPAARLRYLLSSIVPRGVVHLALLVAPVLSIRVYQFAMYRERKRRHVDNAVSSARVHQTYTISLMTCVSSR